MEEEEGLYVIVSTFAFNAVLTPSSNLLPLFSNNFRVLAVSGRAAQRQGRETLGALRLDIFLTYLIKQLPEFATSVLGFSCKSFRSSDHMYHLRT